MYGGAVEDYFSNFGSLKSTETGTARPKGRAFIFYFSNFGSLKSTETAVIVACCDALHQFQQFRLVEEH